MRIEVQVRNINDGEGQIVGFFPPGDIPAVVELFRNTNTVSWGDRAQYDPETFNSTQFVFDDGERYFEIIVGNG